MWFWLEQQPEMRQPQSVSAGFLPSLVLPDGERVLGNLKAGQLILISQKMGPDGPRFDAEAVDPDDPRARNAPITRRRA